MVQTIFPHLDRRGTALNPHVGYENPAKIAQKAMSEKLSLREAAIGLHLLTNEQFGLWVNPANMVRSF